MRLALLGLYHETNTFAAHGADYAAWEASGILRGAAEILPVYGESAFSIAGVLARAREDADVAVVPLFFTFTGPKGNITENAFERLAGEMLGLLRDGGPWDGVLLIQHGAAVAAHIPDADAEIIARARAVVGPRVPIGVASDLHGNVTERYVAESTAVVFFRTNPHLDARERGYECADLIIRTVRGEIHPVQAVETPPLVANITQQFSDVEPMRGIYATINDVLAWPGMLSASIAMGYPYADVPGMGMAFIAVHDGDPAAARRAARHMARAAWARRADLVGDTPSPAAALTAAQHAPTHPVVLLDVGDNVGGGSPADSTHLLAAAQRLGVRRLLMSLYDPSAVAVCAAAGVGNTVSLAVGGKTDALHGSPVPVTGRVRTLFEGKWEDTRPTHGGFRFYDAGVTAVLLTEDDHTLVLTSKREGNTSVGQMYALGLFPEEYQVVVAKGVHSPRPAYMPLAAEVVMVNSPGVTSSDLTTFTYRHRRRPLYPFEPEATYE